MKKKLRFWKRGVGSNGRQEIHLCGGKKKTSKISPPPFLLLEITRLKNKESCTWRLKKEEEITYGGNNRGGEQARKGTGHKG